MKKSLTSHKTNTANVAHLILSPALGGLEQCASMWTTERNRRSPRKSTMLVCLEDIPENATGIRTRPDSVLHAIRSRFPWDREAVRQLRQYICEHNIQILHSHNTAARQYASLVRRTCDIRHVYTDHGTNPHLHGVINRLRLFYMHRRTDAWCAVSDQAATLIAASEHIPMDRINVVCNGISVSSTSMTREREKERMHLRAEWNIQTPYVLGYVGRLSAEKGVDRLINAMPEITPDCTLVVIGDGAQRQNLLAQTKSLGLDSRIIFTGMCQQARQKMKAFDLFVLPSRSEGLPIALLEAMAEGCPSAATDTGACKTVLDNGKAGFILPPVENKWPAIINAMLKSTGSAEMQKTVNDAAGRIGTHYSLTQTLAAYEHIYQDVLNADTAHAV